MSFFSFSFWIAEMFDVKNLAILYKYKIKVEIWQFAVNYDL